MKGIRLTVGGLTDVMGAKATNTVEIRFVVSSQQKP